MYTVTRFRHATRWPRRLLFALSLLLVLAAAWRFYTAWQQAQPHEPEPVTQSV